MSSKGISYPVTKPGAAQRLPVRDNTQGTRGPTNQHADVEANQAEQQKFLDAAHKAMANRDQYGSGD